MTKIKGNCVLITGGASGIGRIMGRMALESGARMLVIWDINQQSIDSTVGELGKLGSVKGYRIDVSDSAAVEECFKRTGAECGDVDIVINCAGIVTGNKTFDKQNITDIERTMKINSVAPMVIALQALPGMLARGKGHICNIASAAGMFDGVQSRFFAIFDPETTSRKILRAIESNRDFKGIPFGFHFIRLCQGLLPTSIFDLVFGKWVGIFSAMDNFKGRK